MRADLPSASCWPRRPRVSAPRLATSQARVTRGLLPVKRNACWRTGAVRASRDNIRWLPRSAPRENTQSTRSQATRPARAPGPLLTRYAEAHAG
jgi:hypothetical protein